MHQSKAGRGTRLPAPSVLGEELTPGLEKWPHPSPQSISEFGGDGAVPRRDPLLSARTQHLSLPLSAWCSRGGVYSTPTK